MPVIPDGANGRGRGRGNALTAPRYARRRVGRWCTRAPRRAGRVVADCAWHNRRVDAEAAAGNVGRADLGWRAGPAWGDVARGVISYCAGDGVLSWWLGDCGSGG